MQLVFFQQRSVRTVSPSLPPLQNPAESIRFLPTLSKTPPSRAVAVEQVSMDGLCKESLQALATTPPWMAPAQCDSQGTYRRLLPLNLEAFIVLRCPWHMITHPMVLVMRRASSMHQASMRRSFCTLDLMYTIAVRRPDVITNGVNMFTSLLRPLLLL